MEYMASGIVKFIPLVNIEMKGSCYSTPQFPYLGAQQFFIYYLASNLHSMEMRRNEKE